MFLHILQRVNSRREDEEHGCSWTGLLKGDGEVQGSANHVLVSQFLLDKISVGGNTTQFLNTLFTHFNLCWQIFFLKMQSKHKCSLMLVYFSSLEELLHMYTYYYVLT